MALNISDSELARRLKDLGVDVGPINNTTREVYFRKYQSLTSKPLSTPHQLPSSSPVQHTNKKHHDTSRPTTPPLPATPPAFPTLSTAGEAVVKLLLSSFNDASHIASDTAFLFPCGEVLLASRSILATQCSKMIPMLYDREVPYPVKVVTLSGQTQEFLVRGGEPVSNLKERISMTCCIPVWEQRLVFMEQELLNSNTFLSYEVFSGATLHLVLVAGGARLSCLSYSCPGVSPTLSIHHFNLGISLEQLLQVPAPLPPVSQPISLPTHLAHVVHVHDNMYSAFKLFLHYLYSRKLQESNGKEWSKYLMCYILGEFFQIPDLPQTCLYAVHNCLDEKLAHALLEFSRKIQSQALEQVCLNYLTPP